jgi:hypothetical protein
MDDFSFPDTLWAIPLKRKIAPKHSSNSSSPSPAKKPTPTETLQLQAIRRLESELKKEQLKTARAKSLLAASQVKVADLTKSRTALFQKQVLQSAKIRELEAADQTVQAERNAARIVRSPAVGQTLHFPAPRAE